MKTKTQTLRNLLAGGLLLVGGQIAPGAQQYSIGWDVIAGGAGAGANGQYALSGTIGQFDVGGPIAAGSESVVGGFWQIPGGPVLSIQLTGPNTIVVSWTAPALGCFVLQQASSLSGSSWVDVPASVTFANGTDQVTVSTSEVAQFYRLVSRCP